MKRTRTLRAIGAAGLVLALTGCIKLDMDLTVHADDTVDGTMIFGFNREMSDMMGEEADMFDGMMDELLDMDLGEDAPDEVTVEPYDDGTFVGQEMTFQGMPLEEFGGDEGTSELRLARDGDEFVFEGDMDMSDTGEMGDVPPGMLEGMMEFDMRVSITFPGEVLEHNGSLSGTTVTWEPDSRYFNFAGHPRSSVLTWYPSLNAGTYTGQCAEFCGFGHWAMIFLVEAMERADYDAWLEEALTDDPDQPPIATPPPDAQIIELTANNNVFDTDRLEVPANEVFVIRFHNEDTGIPHDVDILGPDGETIFDGHDFPGPATVDYIVDPLEPGEYEFICSIHPLTMRGTLVASE
jgi:plastocyanin